MTLDYEKFMLKQSEWRGVVTTKLDNLNSEIAEMKDTINGMDKKIDSVNRKINNTNIKVAGIAGTISIIIAIVINSLV